MPPEIRQHPPIGPHDAALPVDNAAFSQLFFQPKKNKDAIWIEMCKIVRIATEKVWVRQQDDMAGIKGDALIHAMDSISSYDPTRLTAFAYFHGVILNEMQRLADLRRPATISEDALDVPINFNDFHEQSPDYSRKIAMEKANPNNWESYRLPMECKEKAEKYFQKRLETSRKLYRKSQSNAEKVTLTVMIEVLKQSRRALVG